MGIVIERYGNFWSVLSRFVTGYGSTRPCAVNSEAMKNRHRRSRSTPSALRDKKVATEILRIVKAVMHVPTHDYESYEQALHNHLLPIIDRMEPGCDAREIWRHALSWRNKRQSSYDAIVDTVSALLSWEWYEEWQFRPTFFRETLAAVLAEMLDSCQQDQEQDTSRRVAEHEERVSEHGNGVYRHQRERELPCDVHLSVGVPPLMAQSVDAGSISKRAKTELAESLSSPDSVQERECGQGSLGPPPPPLGHDSDGGGKAPGQFVFPGRCSEARPPGNLIFLPMINLL